VPDTKVAPFLWLLWEVVFAARIRMYLFTWEMNSAHPIFPVMYVGSGFC
jgi:hypothetical protein